MHRLSKINLRNTSEMAMACRKNQIILIQGVILATCISHCIGAVRTV